MRLPGFVTRNLRAKALAMGIALVTWVAVVYAGNPLASRSLSLHVPQDPASLPAKYVLATPIPDVVVRISGTRDHVNAFDTGSLRITTDYRFVNHTGHQQVPVKIVNNDHNVSLDNVPTSVDADIDVRDSVALQVTVVVDPPPPTGYVITQQSVDPNPVVVTGPRRDLSGLSAQVHLNMANQKTNLEGDYKVFLFNRFGQRVGDLGVTPGSVRVTVTVSSVQTSRASAVLPRVNGAVAAGHQLAGITVSPATVTLNGPQELLNALDSVSTEAISIAGLTGDRTFQVRLTPPAGVSASPDVVTVTVSVVALPTPAPTPSPTPSPSPSPTPSASPTPTTTTTTSAASTATTQ